MGLFSWFTGEDTIKRKKLEDKLARKKMVRYVRHKLRLPGSTSSSSPLSSDASLATTNRKLRHTVQKLADQASRRRSHGHISKSRKTRAEARDKKARKYEKKAEHHRSVAEKHRSKKKSRSSSSSSSSSGSTSSTSISEDADLLVNLDPADAATLEKAIQILQNIRNKSTGAAAPNIPSPAAMKSAVNAAVRASVGKDAPRTEAALENAADAAGQLDVATREASALVAQIQELNAKQTALVHDLVKNGATPDIISRVIQQAKEENAALKAEGQAKLKEAEALIKAAEKDREKLDAAIVKEQPPGVVRKAANGIGSFISNHKEVVGGLAVALTAYALAPVVLGAAGAAAVVEGAAVAPLVAPATAAGWGAAALGAYDRVASLYSKGSYAHSLLQRAGVIKANGQVIPPAVAVAAPVAAAPVAAPAGGRTRRRRR
jgi:hypothetical protein